jgi:hypothetical protein
MFIDLRTTNYGIGLTVLAAPTEKSATLARIEGLLIS